MTSVLSAIDYFIPPRSRGAKSDLGRARIFVLTHLGGPISGAAIVAYLFANDPAPGLVVPAIGLGIASFWALPLALRFFGDLRVVALISVQVLMAVTLLGAYNYGGVSSPFMAWLLIALANGFFYLSDRPKVVLATFAFNVAVFSGFCMANVLPHRVPTEKMATVGIISVVSATLYMAVLAIYYGRLLTSESVFERELQRHRRTAERLQEARQKAEKASRERSLFLAKMSHELRTPLNAVIGYSEILLEDAEAADDDQRINDLSRINTAGKHLLSLVTDILDIAKIESREIKLQIGAFDVRKLIAEVAATSAPLVAKNGNRLEIRVESSAGVMVSDELRMRQAVLNLVSNAAKFTNRGVVTVSARRLRVSSRDWIEIEVRDTGIGIKPEDLKTLFQNFHQINSVEARKAKGTGLGLALTHSLCNLMGGGVFAESEYGHGACFVIRAPADIKVNQNPETDATPADESPLKQAA